MVIGARTAEGALVFYKPALRERGLLKGTTSLFGRRDAALVFATVSLLYLALYLAVVGRLVPGGGEVGLLVADDLSIAFRSTGTFTFEPIARIDLGFLSLLFSPLDTLVGLVLPSLVGLNLALFYLAWTQPTACGIEGASGALAAIPALLSGTTCCGPVLLIVLGIQVSGLLVAVFDVLFRSRSSRYSRA